MVVLNQELGLEASLKMISEQVVLSEQLVQDTQNNN
jgi:hypothetical protein